MWVSNEPMRRAFLNDGRSAHALADQLDWRKTIRPRGNYARLAPDSDRVLRELGIVPYWNRGRLIYKQSVLDSTAIKLADVLNLDPIDIGL